MLWRAEVGVSVTLYYIRGKVTNNKRKSYTKSQKFSLCLELHIIYFNIWQLLNTQNRHVFMSQCIDLLMISLGVSKFFVYKRTTVSYTKAHQFHIRKISELIGKRIVFDEIAAINL